MRAGKVAGIQFVFNNWFLALLVLFTIAGLLGKILLVFSAIFCHEVAHAITAHLLGLTVREIEILPFGGVARIDRLNEAEPGKDIMIAAAGPASSLLLAAITWLIMLKLPYHGELLPFFLQVNMMLACFNLVPALPLDGGRIARAWLCQIWDYNRATEVVVTISKAIGIIFIIVSAGMVLLDGTFNITFIVAGVFLYAAARAETRTAGFRVMQTLARKKEILMSRGLLPTIHYTALGSTTVKEVVRLFHPEHYHIVLVVDDDLTVRGHITETELWKALTDRGLYIKISSILE